MLLPLTTSGPLHWGMMLAIMFVSMVERVGAPQAPRWGVDLARAIPARLPIRRINAGSVSASSSPATR